VAAPSSEFSAEASDRELSLVKWIVRSSLADLIVCDGELLCYDIPPERSIAGVLARSIAARVPSTYKVDVEFHRSRAGRKVVLDPDGRERGRNPDVIVHRRGKTGTDHNLLMIELKSRWTGAQNSEDLLKVDQSIKQIGYKFGAVISFLDTTGKLQLRWQWRPKDEGDSPVFKSATLQGMIQRGEVFRSMAEFPV